MTDINVGQLSEAINEKMDRDGSNIASPKLSIFLVDVQYPTAENSYTWYRLYSDGWVEQGGYRTSVSNTIVTLPIPMADTNYTLIKTINNDYQGNANGVTWGSTSAAKISTTQIRLNQTSGGDMQSWQVSGMSGSSSNNSSSGGSSGSGGGTPDPTPGGAGTTTK